MPKRAFWSSPLALTAIMVCASGCTDELLIGNFDAAATLAPDAGSDAGVDAGTATDAGFSLPDGGAPGFDANVDPSAQVLLSVSNALGLGGGRWLSPATAQRTLFANLQLAFEPSFSTAEGKFIGFCPDGCPFLDLFKDAGIPSGRGTGSGKPDTFTGHYALYHLAMPAGTVFGVLYTDDGQISIDLQVELDGRPSNGPLDQIFIVFPPLGRIAFLPYHN